MSDLLVSVCVEMEEFGLFDLFVLYDVLIGCVCVGGC